MQRKIQNSEVRAWASKSSPNAVYLAVIIRIIVYTLSIGFLIGVLASFPNPPLLVEVAGILVASICLTLLLFTIQSKIKAGYAQAYYDHWLKRRAEKLAELGREDLI